MLTIGLIDNYPVARVGLSVFLSSHFKELTLVMADSHSNFLKQHGSSEPDLVILGINELEMSNNFWTVKESKSCFPSVPVIVYDQNYHKGITADYIRSGIKGHVLKQCHLSELIDCIQAVLQGKLYIAQILHQKLRDEWLNYSLNGVFIQKLTNLAPRQREIALFLMEGKSTSMIANLLNCRPSTVSTIKKQIFSKMRISNTAELTAMFTKKC